MPAQLCRHPRHRQSRWRFYITDGLDPNNILSVRLVTPDDSIRERLFFESMSMDDRYKRFFHPKKYMSDKEVKQATRVDYFKSFKIAAVSRATDKFAGTAVFFGYGDGCVEAAVCVLDQYKGHGLGGLLVDLLWRAAIEEFHAKRLNIEHLTSNGAVRKIFDRAAERYSVGCSEEPPEDGMKAVTWELKSSLEDLPLQVRELDEVGMNQKYEVMRPAAHPWSLWSFELRMLVPHQGEIAHLQVRPLTPDDEVREAAYITNLGEKAMEWVRQHHLRAHADAHDLSEGEATNVSEAKQLTHYNFGKEFAIAALHLPSDSIVGVARWVDAKLTGEAEAFFSVLESWRGIGVGAFLADVIMQSAITEGKTSLSFEAPVGVPYLLEVAEQVAAKHSSELSRVENKDAVSITLTAKLKEEVDHPVQLTRLPGFPSA